MSKFSTRLKELRASREISQQTLADKVGMSKSSINMYERGEREPGLEILEVIADYFNVDIDYLVGKSQIPNKALERAQKNISAKDDISQYPGIYRPKMRKVPLLGKVACGQPIYSPNFDDGFALINNDIPADFALEANGDSMIGVGIHTGDIVYFVEQEMVDNGQLAAVFVDDEVTLKRVYYYREENKLILQSENPKHAPLVYMNEELDQIRIIGKAVALYRKIR